MPRESGVRGRRTDSYLIYGLFVASLLQHDTVLGVFLVPVR